ncbi:MAG: endonuclease/exonuclease/phosphatase family protein [Hyphomicrobiales bacterium]|nr:endonuclease/exonuclease/phosphatase family protein [Hyphomicrobiales bacterium]
MPRKLSRLRVATYNVHRGVGSDRRRDLGRIAAVIGEIDADIIGLQEVDWRHDHTDESGRFELLSHLPGYRAVAGPNMRDHRGHYGNLLLTRLDVQQVRLVDLGPSNREPRGAIDADFHVCGENLRVIVTHLGLGLLERWRQAKRLRDIVSGRMHHPTVLLGDLNEWLPGSPTLRPLLGICQSTARPASYPSCWPAVSLDRILTHAVKPQPAVRAHDTRIARKASDHLPIVADLDLP